MTTFMKWRVEAVEGKARKEGEQAAKRVDLAAKAHELSWYIVKTQNDPSTWRDLDRSNVSADGEVEEVREAAVWQHHRPPCLSPSLGSLVTPLPSLALTFPRPSLCYRCARPSGSTTA